MAETLVILAHSGPVDSYVTASITPIRPVMPEGGSLPRVTTGKSTVDCTTIIRQLCREKGFQEELCLSSLTGKIDVSSLLSACTPFFPLVGVMTESFLPLRFLYGSGRCLSRIAVMLT